MVPTPPGWPVPHALRRSSASAPRTSPIGMRSGRRTKRRTHKVGQRADPVLGPQRNEVGRGALKLASVLNENHPVGGLGHFGEERVDERGLARRGAASDEDVAPGRDRLAEGFCVGGGQDASVDISAQSEHRDSRPADRKRGRSNNRRQQPLEALAGLWQARPRTRGLPGWTSAPTWCATRRTIRSPSAADIRSPVSSRPPARRSIHSRPSGFSITSAMLASSSQAAIRGPSAVRSIRAPRLADSDRIAWMGHGLGPSLLGRLERPRCCSGASKERQTGSGSTASWA